MCPRWAITVSCEMKSKRLISASDFPAAANSETCLSRSGRLEIR
jgi:hypothetical protein